METAEFKKIVDEIVISNGMQKRSSYYYLESKEIMVVLGLQKSSYSSSYYFNLGYVINDLNKKANPIYTDGNIRLRFDFNLNEKKTDIVDSQLNEIANQDWVELAKKLCELRLKKIVDVKLGEEKPQLYLILDSGEVLFTR